ncbi:sugar transferase [Erythrobacter sp. SG61-1L]|uniref:sugar transferase n=1 Tax=Erythrobacter sp. SG61-1L TaxID=1603897 RepID=UPI0006C91F4A|nr:sugar transferase [Erythrobacter sp. SG61-1L]
MRGTRIKRRLLAVALVVSDMIACLVAVLLSQLAYGAPLNLAVAGTVLGVTFPVYFLAGLQTGAHNPSVAHRAGASIRSAGIAFAVTAAIFFFALFATKLGAQVSRLQVGQTLLICLVLGTAARYAIAQRAQRMLGPKPFADLCIYDDVPMRGARGPGAIRAVEAGLVPNLARPEMVSRLGALARGMDRVVVHCSTERREAWSRALKCVDIRSEIVMPELTGLMPLDIRHRNGEVSLVLANGPLRWHQRLMKNLFDRAVAAVALVLCLPLMGLIALAVKLDSPGPVLFGQERIGLGNRHFKIWKFRTMRAEHTDHRGDVSTERGDYRITRLGAFLRNTSLDELPQLYNVLIGQMSIVGPRPHAAGSRAEQLLFWDIDERYWYRHSIKPGLTGLAQVRGLRGATLKRCDFEQRLFADLEYVANWSLLSDLLIIFKTFQVLVHRNAF